MDVPLVPAQPVPSPPAGSRCSRLLGVAVQSVLMSIVYIVFVYAVRLQRAGPGGVLASLLGQPTLTESNASSIRCSPWLLAVMARMGLTRLFSNLP